MALCNTKTLYLVVNGVDMSITATPARINDLEDFLLGLRASKNNVKFTLNIEEFSLFQQKLKEVCSKSY